MRTSSASSADELATFCLHALNAAAALRTRTRVQRLVGVALAGVRAPRRGADLVARGSP